MKKPRHGVTWACPQCSATASGRHGRGGKSACREEINETCLGFLCECCEDSDRDHGLIASDRCPNATCHHCGWSGTFPLAEELAKNWPRWARTALEEGWFPPRGWAPKEKKP